FYDETARIFGDHGELAVVEWGLTTRPAEVVDRCRDDTRPGSTTHRGSSPTRPWLDFDGERCPDRHRLRDRPCAHSRLDISSGVRRRHATRVHVPMDSHAGRDLIGLPYDDSD